ncbi:MAG: hotdog fold domain-containing protein [Rhodanobacter sp.]
MSASVLSLYHRITRWPAGHWIFSRLVCFKAPYFATIAPRFVALEPGRCEVRIRDRRRVRNHIGTVHAIALCNLAELGAGVMTDATIPADMRWIPKGMTVEYLKKAVGTLHGVAMPDTAIRSAVDGYEWPVGVQVTDTAGEVVFRAPVIIWVSPRKRA